MTTQQTIPYVDTDGRPRDYPQSFGLDDLEKLAELVLSRQHSTMIEVFDDRGGPQTMHTVVRHDVDHSIDHALRFARWEASLGIRSSYYVLHTAWYFANDFESTMSKCREIVRLGHEVGIHHNALTAAAKVGGNGEPGTIARYVLQSALIRMHAAGVKVRGAAAHGSELGFDNLKMWDVFDLSTFGLDYEAYKMHGDMHANYVSDNRGTLRAPLEHVDGRPTHLLVHPEHWKIS